MGSVVKITINDFAEKGAENGARRMMIEQAIQIHAQTVGLCPVDLGQLANSYMWKIEDETAAFNTAGTGELAPESDKLKIQPIKKLQGYVGTGSDHWYPEFGTRYQRAQPHLRPAGELSKRGANVAAIAKKYGPEAMEEEFRRRKVRRKTVRSN